MTPTRKRHRPVEAEPPNPRQRQADDAARLLLTLHLLGIIHASELPTFAARVTAKYKTRPYKRLTHTKED